jgi:fatty-acid desaturase
MNVWIWAIKSGGLTTKSEHCTYWSAQTKEIMGFELEVGKINIQLLVMRHFILFWRFLMC